MPYNAYMLKVSSMTCFSVQVKNFDLREYSTSFKIFIELYEEFCMNGI